VETQEARVMNQVETHPLLLLLDLTLAHLLPRAITRNLAPPIIPSRRCHCSAKSVCGGGQQIWANADGLLSLPLQNVCFIP
jgi:hypothetical protein